MSKLKALDGKCAVGREVVIAVAARTSLKPQELPTITEAGSKAASCQCLLSEVGVGQRSEDENPQHTPRHVVNSY